MPKKLADVVRDKVDAGTLPLDSARILWAGWGAGKPCTVCEQPILTAQTEYEAEYDDDRPVIRLHIGCHGVWEAERHKRGYLPND